MNRRESRIMHGLMEERKILQEKLDTIDPRDNTRTEEWLFINERIGVLTRRINKIGFKPWVDGILTKELEG